MLAFHNSGAGTRIRTVQLFFFFLALNSNNRKGSESKDSSSYFISNWLVRQFGVKLKTQV